MTEFKILFVEDDDETRENYTFLLQSFYSDVDSCSNGDEAITLYDKNLYDLIILDINLPLKNGIYVAEYIRKEDEFIPIIMLTAYSDRDRLLAAVSLKLEYYLIKPISDKKLINVINKIVQKNGKDKINKTVIVEDKLVWTYKEETLFYKREEFKLTKKERILVRQLIDNIGMSIDNDTLILNIWSDVIPDDSHNQKLTQLIYRFNKKINDLTDIKTQLIKNNYSIGYKIEKF